jgi:hypothetical protein
LVCLSACFVICENYHFKVQDSSGSKWPWLYFTTLIVFGSFLVVNLVLGVLSWEFTREREKLKARGAFRKLREQRLIDSEMKLYLQWVTKGEVNRKKRSNSLASPGIEWGASRPSMIEECLSEDVTLEQAGCGGIGPCAGLRQRCKAAWDHLKEFNTTCQEVVQRMVKSQTFCWAVIMFVVSNTACLAAEHHGQPKWMDDLLEISNVLFVVLFTLEMLAKLYGLGVHGYFMSRFNRLDFLVVLASIIETVVHLSLGAPRFGLSVLRCVRLLRIFKLVPKYWLALNNLVASLLNSIKSILSLLFLLFLFILIFALLGMQIFGGRFNFDDGVPRPNFDSFVSALIAVFQILTCEDWNEVMYVGIQAYGGIGGPGALASLYFIVVVLFGNYILLNVFLAIAVDNLADAQSLTDEQEKQLKKNKKRREAAQKRIENNSSECETSEAALASRGSIPQARGKSAMDANLKSSFVTATESEWACMCCGHSAFL